MRILHLGALAVGSCLMSGCAIVPPLSEATGSIPIHDVVERIKCELADSFDQKTTEKDFLWLQTWTAKVDMTLAANNQGSITPVGSYVEPLGSVGGVAQTFTFGAGASISGQAVRTEALSFSLSLKELKQWRQEQLRKIPVGAPDPCYPGFRTDWAGDLGLREWVNSALSPVALSDLQAGDHPAPGTAKSAGKAAPPSGAGSKSIVEKSPRELADEAAAQAKRAYTSADAMATEAEKSSRQAAASVANSPFRAVEDEGFLAKSLGIVKVAKEQASVARTDASTAKKEFEKAQTMAQGIGVDDRTDAAKANATLAQNAATEADKLAADAKEQAKAAKQNAALVSKRIPDPPIDSISHSVQFLVTTSASIAPSWTLVRFRGPTGNLAGATAIQTHTLNIALGPRGDNGAAYSQEAVRVLQNLTLQQIRLGF